MRDLVSQLNVVNNVRYGDHNAATVAAVSCDLRGYNGAMVHIDVGTMTGAGTFTPVLQESVDGSIWTDVAAAEIIGTAPVALTTDTDQQFGYNGAKRYIGIPVTKAATVSAANFGITIVLGRASSEPTAVL